MTKSLMTTVKALLCGVALYRENDYRKTPAAKIFENEKRRYGMETAAA